MLEGLVAWVLNNYVGEYFENLNTDQLSIALLQGQVELENVPVKKTALRKFDIPVQVKSGVIGRLTLSIPIAMRSEPWILKMSDLLILLGPSTSKYDVEFVEQYEQSKKQQALDALELHHKKQLLMTIGQKLKEDDSERNQWWGASVVSAITNNMQVILNNIHIRYEDNNISGKLDGAFNFGIRIENVTIQTTNCQWKPGFVQSTNVGPDGKPTNIFKKLDIRRLSVYWNCAEPFMPKPASNDGASSVISVNDLKNQMSPENTRFNTFILQQPFCMEVRMEKNSSKFPLKTVPLIPRFKFDLRPERIEIELSKRQLAQMRMVGREWARFDRARQHRKWRPLVPISESPKSWWKFAYDRVVEEHRRHHCCLSKENLLRRAKHMNAYCKAYRRKLVGLLKNYEGTEKQAGTTKENRSTSPNQEDMAFMKQIEHDSQFTYDELHLFRETVFRKYINQLTQKEKSQMDQDEPEIFELIAGDSPDPQPVSKVARLDKSNGFSHKTTTSSPVHSPTSQSAPISGDQAPPGGWYGWMASWFGKESTLADIPAEEDLNEGLLLDMWPKIEKEQQHHLSPDLKLIEKRMEEEIMDVLSESWDDSTILRRDNLLAELVLRLDRLVIRFLDEGGPGQSSTSNCSRVWHWT